MPNFRADVHSRSVVKYNTELTFVVANTCICSRDGFPCVICSGEIVPRNTAVCPCWTLPSTLHLPAQQNKQLAYESQHNSKNYYYYYYYYKN